jgi:hypothetical protein
MGFLTSDEVWCDIIFQNRSNLTKCMQIVPENAYGTVSRARWIILDTRLRSCTRIKARERFRRRVPRIIHLALKPMPYAYNEYIL